MKKLKIGMIGLGGIADLHSRGILDSPDAEIYAICDINLETLARRAGEWNVPKDRTYSRYQELLANPEIDAVTIGVPNDVHFPIAMEAVRQRKPFALEKPITLNVAEAASLKEALDAEPLPHMICFTYRYKKAARYARWMISQGMLGDIQHIYSQYLQSWGINHEVPLFWRFQKDRTGSGAMGDLGCHLLDLNRFLLGVNVCGVLADAGTIIGERQKLDGSGLGPVDVDDYCHVLARMEQGVTATMAISRFAYGRGNYQQIEVYGSKGALVYQLEEEDGLQIKLAESGDTVFHSVDIPAEFQGNQMQAFVDLVNGKSDGLNATIADGYQNQVAVDAIVESFTEEKWVHL
jgi:predicted dehydrogenase